MDSDKENKPPPLPTSPDEIKLLGDLTALHTEKTRQYLSLIFSLSHKMVFPGFSEAVVNPSTKTLTLYHFVDIEQKPATPTWDQVIKECSVAALVFGGRKKYTIHTKTSKSTRQSRDFRSWCIATQAYMDIRIPCVVPMGRFSVLFEGNWEVAAHALFGRVIDINKNSIDEAIVMASAIATPSNPNCFIYCCADNNDNGNVYDDDNFNNFCFLDNKSIVL